MHEVQGAGRVGAEILMVAGVTVQYFGTRAALVVLGTPDGSAPGRRALAQWLPVMATTLAALAMGHPEVAVALVFGSSVACLSLVLGMSSYVGPLQEFPASRRLWPLVLPAAVFALLAGFRGSLHWYHAILLLVMGAAVLSVWMESPSGAPVATRPQDQRVGSMWALVALAVIGAGAWAAARGAITTGEGSRLLTPPLLAATVLSPLLLLPALGTSSMLAQHGHTAEVITALVGTVLLNLCLLLPVVILGWYLISGFAHLPDSPATAAGFFQAAQATPYPLLVWRVDAVLLVVLGFALLPVAAGRWLPERTESLLLVLLYAAYLVAETAVSARLL